MNKDKYILVTGAYGGMGYAAACVLRDEGYNVIGLDISGCADSDGIRMIAADITSEESVAGALRAVREITDSLYAILHFAGVYMLDSLVEMGEERIKKIYDVNLFGVMRVNRIFMPMLSEGSRIVITTSELAPLDPLPFTGIYAITKAALDKYAYSLRMELQLLGISVSVLRPGAVDTGMIGKSVEELDKFIETTSLYSCNAERFKSIVDSVEARRVPVEKIGRLSAKILKAKNPRQVYSINRNPLLILLGVLPRRLQTAVIRLILKK